MKEIEQWDREVESLLCQLATLIHLSSGLPSRMSEFSRLRYANGNGSKRNLFIYKNRFATLIPNSKAKNEVFRHKGIPRFIPKGRISQALASFLLYVRPTQLVFANLFEMGGLTAMSVYLFSSWDKAEHWTGTYLCLQFKRWFNDWVSTGRSLGISEWRQVAVAYSRFHFQSTLELDRQGHIVDVQCGHRGLIAYTHYAIENQSHPDIPPDMALHFEQVSDT